MSSLSLTWCTKEKSLANLSTNTSKESTSSRGCTTCDSISTPNRRMLWSSLEFRLQMETSSTDLNTWELERSLFKLHSQTGAISLSLKLYTGDSEVHLSDQQEQEKPNLLKLWVHNLVDMSSFSTATKHLMEMQWVEYLLVSAKSVHGVALTNLTDLKRECYLLFHNKSYSFKLG